MIYNAHYQDQDRMDEETCPYKYFKYYDEESVGDRFMDRVFTLLEHSVTNDLYGLTFNDLIHMDLATFETIEKRVAKMSEKKGKVLDELTKKGKQDKETK